MWAGPLHNPYFVQQILDRLPTLDKAVYGTLDRLRGMLTVALEEDLTLGSANTDTRTTSAEGAATTTTTAAAAGVVEGMSMSPATRDLRMIPRLPPDAIDESPFFFIPNYVAKVLHCATPAEDQLRGAIRRLGYRVTRSHCKPGSFRTDAPWGVIWEIFREWVRTKSPTKEDAVRPGTAGWGILRRARGTERKGVTDFKEDLRQGIDKAGNWEDVKTAMEAAMWRLQQQQQQQITPTDRDPVPALLLDQKKTTASATAAEDGSSTTTTTKPLDELEIVFDERLGKDKPRGKLVRYQTNPCANWGPMNRAGGQ